MDGQHIYYKNNMQCPEYTEKSALKQFQFFKTKMNCLISYSKNKPEIDQFKVRKNEN